MHSDIDLQQAEKQRIACEQCLNSLILSLSVYVQCGWQTSVTDAGIWSPVLRSLYSSQSNASFPHDAHSQDTQKATVNILLLRRWMTLAKCSHRGMSWGLSLCCRGQSGLSHRSCSHFGQTATLSGSWARGQVPASRAAHLPVLHRRIVCLDRVSCKDAWELCWTRMVPHAIREAKALAHREVSVH